MHQVDSRSHRAYAASTWCIEHPCARPMRGNMEPGPLQRVRLVTIPTCRKFEMPAWPEGLVDEIRG